MTRLVTWTNNSTDYLGTEIFRGASLDPENLPEPVATVGPVAQGVRAEWPDRDGEGDLCYLVRDFDSEGVGEVSEGYCYDEPSPFDGAQIGDELEGGIYAGEIEYGDGRRFHLVGALESGSVFRKFADGTPIDTAANDVDDGLANTLELDGDAENYPAVAYCLSYTNQGHDDWYLPSNNEMAQIQANLAAAGHPEFDNSLSSYRWTSTVQSDSFGSCMRWSDGNLTTNTVTGSLFVRPIRRVPV